MGYSYYTIHDATVYETDSNASVTISRTGDTSHRERVWIQSTSGSARKEYDYNFSKQWVTFEPYQTSAKVHLNIAQDHYKEADEDFRVWADVHYKYYHTQRDLKGYHSFSNTRDIYWRDSSGTVTIKDGSPLPDAVFSVSDSSTTEGGTLTFTISRTGDTTRAGRVHYYTSSGSGSDRYDIYDVSSSVYFSSGQTEKTITVRTREDSLVENDETINLNLSTGTTGFKLDTTRATGTVVDNDKPVPPSLFTVSDAEAIEGGNLTFTISRTGDTSRSGRVNYYTSSGSGIDRYDIYDVSSSVYFYANQT